MRVSGDDEARRWDRRGHFFAAAASRCAAFSSSGPVIISGSNTAAGASGSISTAAIMRADPSFTDLVAVDEALTRLEQTDPRKAQVVSLRYFAGLSVEETANALDLSRRPSRTSGSSRGRGCTGARADPEAARSP